MKTPEKLVRLIRESEIITNPGVDDRILYDARNELAKRRRDNRAPLDAVLWRALMKNKMIRFGTAFVVIIAAVVAFQFLGNPFGTKLTFANAIEPILNADTATYDIVYGPDDGSTPVVHYMVMGSRHRRTSAGGEIIMDTENGRMLILYNKVAQYQYFEEVPSGQNFLDNLKNYILILKDDPDFTVKELGRKQLDGKEVVGFFASNPKIDFTIWADVDTKLPVRIETNEGQSREVLKNMKFGLPLEEDLFSMEVPAGYMVLEPITWDDLQEGTEAKFIEGLRLIAEIYNDGYFPDGVSFDSFTKWIHEVAKQLEEMNFPKEEIGARIQQIFEDFCFIPFFRPEEEWTYRGRGVQLGEADTPIFWYKPQGSETYHVIYGDLHVEDVDPEDLPQ
jgi:hypothetical protein